jgi:hypothetical protein
MSVEFYDVKKREKVQLPDGQIKKTKITQKNGQVRYAFRGTTEDGRKLTRFCSKSDWDASGYPEE